MKGHGDNPPSCTHSPASLFLPQNSSKLEQGILYALPLDDCKCYVAYIEQGKLAKFTLPIS